MAWFSLLVLASIVMCFAFLVVRNTRRTALRLAWLKERHLIISFSDFANKAKDFATVVQIDFGSGKEVWVTQLRDKSMLIHPNEPVISDGFRLYPNPKKVEVDELCRQTGLQTLDIYTMFCQA